jgi:hypothetical protein
MKNLKRCRFTAIATMISLRDVKGFSITFQQASFQQWNSGKHVEEVIEHHQYPPS